MRNPVGLKRCRNFTLLEGLTSDETKTSEGLIILYFGKMITSHKNQEYIAFQTCAGLTDSQPLFPAPPYQLRQRKGTLLAILKQGKFQAPNYGFKISMCALLERHNRVSKDKSLLPFIERACTFPDRIWDWLKKRIAKVLLPGLLLLYNFIVKIYKVIIRSYCLNLSSHFTTSVF